MSAVDHKARGIPWVGPPVDEGAGGAGMGLPDGRGRGRDVQHASIYRTAQTGADEVHGAIRDKWASTR